MLLTLNEVQATLPFPVLRARDLPKHIAHHVPRHPHNRAEIHQIVSLFAHLQPSASNRRR